MPLCKRCHDTIKTPADNTRMAKVTPCIIRLVWPNLRSAIPCTVNGIELRFSLSSKMKMAEAHAMASAAIEGIVKASQRGELMSAGISIVLDDSRLAMRLRACYGVDIEEIPHHGEETKSNSKQDDWLEAFRSNERNKRSQIPTGSQPERDG